MVKVRLKNGEEIKIEADEVEFKGSSVIFYKEGKMVKSIPDKEFKELSYRKSWGEDFRKMWERKMRDIEENMMPVLLIVVPIMGILLQKISIILTFISPFIFLPICYGILRGISFVLSFMDYRKTHKNMTIKEVFEHIRE